MALTIVLNKEDVNNPLHPHLWDSFLEMLGIDEDEDVTELVLERSLLDHNKLRVHSLDKRKN